jgi:U4/U6 small nuclear ribonucleoprotein PRP4
MQRGIHFGTVDEEPIPSNDHNQIPGISLDALEASNQPTRSSAPNRYTSMTVEQVIGVSQLDQKKQARELIVPTDNVKVMENLMLIGEPITLFGEGPYQRRERLKALLVDKRVKARLEDALAKLEEEQKGEQTMVTDKDEFFVPGAEELVGFRKWILNYSMARANDRLAAERQLRSGSMNQIKEGRQRIYERLKGYKSQSSQVGCERPLSFGSFSPDGALFATGGFGGSCKVWSTQDSQLQVELPGHPSRTNCVRFHPHAPNSQMGGLHLASSSDEGTIGLWNLEAKQQIGTLRGHTAKIPRFQFHPSGLCLGSVSFDYSWRLWDLERQTELQLQEGHTRPVYCIDFHPDGSLAGTGGLDAIGRIWDIRVGRSIWALTNEHVKGLLALKFSSTGYEVATASEDCTVRLWDLRALKVAYTLPAHTSTVSDLAWTADGSGLVSASYDGTAKVWGRHGWKLLATLEGHGSKVMSVDVSRTGQIGTTGYDRTFKFWL